MSFGFSLAFPLGPQGRRVVKVSRSGFATVSVGAVTSNSGRWSILVGKPFNPAALAQLSRQGGCRGQESLMVLNAVVVPLNHGCLCYALDWARVTNVFLI